MKIILKDEVYRRVEATELTLPENNHIFGTWDFDVKTVMQGSGSVRRRRKNIYFISIWHLE